MTAPILVYGATGHTARFVIDELLRHGLTPVLGVRTGVGLDRLRVDYASLDGRVAVVDDPAAMRRVVDGVSAVINCAGPFIDTALPLAKAAVEAGAHYLDLSAEQNATQALYEALDEPARDAGVAVIPAMGFYGALADLLLSALVAGGTAAGHVDVAVGLTRWWPTIGTRATGARNTVPRLMIRDGKLAAMPLPPAQDMWAYPEPLGTQPVVQLPFSEVITINRHLEVASLRSFLNMVPLDDLRDSATPAPAATDEDGRSEQRFVIDIVARSETHTRRITAAGRDIYATSAPIIVEGTLRLLHGRAVRNGALAPGQAFEAHDVLAALERGSSALAVTRSDATSSGILEE